jgi:hypothetical protein
MALVRLKIGGRRVRAHVECAAVFVLFVVKWCGNANADEDSGEVALELASTKQRMR